MTSINLANLTPQAIQQSLQDNGLAALGLTTVALSPRWSDVTPSAADYNATAMTVLFSSNLRAPFLGIRQNVFRDVKATLANAVGPDDQTLTVTAGQGQAFPSPVAPGRILLTLSNSSGEKQEILECISRAGDVLTVIRGAQGTAKQAFAVGDTVRIRLSALDRVSEFYDVSGAPVNVHGTAFRFHPQAFFRLQTICAGRYSAGQPLTLPLPLTMLIRGAEGFRAARWYRADEVIENVTGQVSFHDARGHILDPLYVASLFSDLQSPAALPGLVPNAVTANANGPGGVTTIAALAPATTRVHLMDPHGNPPRIASPGASLIITDNAGNPIDTVSNSVITLTGTDRLAPNTNTPANPTPLRIGFATNGVLTANPLAPPPLSSGALAHRFYRVMVVDQNWYLIGNRTNATVLGVPGDDGRIPPDLLPIVRDQINLTYLIDGPDVLADATRILNLPNQSMIMAGSPVIEQLLIAPNAPGPLAHWPLFPQPNTNTGFVFPAVPLSAANISAAFTANRDVVVTLNPGIVPDGASVRIYPQKFVEIASINVAEPSFVRGDGGSGIAVANTALSILLRNPFQLGSAQATPNPAILNMDIVVTPRAGSRRLTAGVSLNVTAGPVPAPPNVFVAPAGTTIMSVMPAVVQGICDSPLFGIPRTVAPPPAAPTNLLELVLSLAAEPSPRKAPRLPTMARFETIVAVGQTGGPPQSPIQWQAVLSGGHWSHETRSAFHAQGNPGNPSGPDVHAPGLTVTGALAYDLAVHALKRAQPFLPLPTSSAGVMPGWLVASAGDNFDVPSDAANTLNTDAGVLLETVAVGCETPWLGPLAAPPPNLTVNQMISNAASAMGVTAPAVTITVNNEPRLQREVRREFFAAQQGFRDAQWALRRAFAEARELVYIESPQIARTARPSGAPQKFEVDLIAELAARLAAFPNLKVLLCTPRASDFADNFKSFQRQHYAARMEALANLQAVAKDRVLLFHPVGFPGRPAYIRTTSIIVDDVWCLTGATHFRRRGMTFDGSAAIASFDRQISNGYSTKIRNYRRGLMAAKLSIAVPANTLQISGEWVRLGSTSGAFDVVLDMLAQGGLGKIQSIFPGPPSADTSVLPAQPATADPDGSLGSAMFTTLAGMLNEAGEG